MPTGHASLMPALRRVVLAGTAAERTDGQLLGAFVADRDADAFGALVRRHGPMVLGVCRRLLADHATADDAFQAVFLVLARRAAAVRPRERVGNWLYGVAYRTALKARAALARRRSREKQVPVMPEPPAAPPRDEWADLRPVLDEELAALPEKLRTPVVLCDLEGRPQREVARALGLPPATLATRLAAARRTLARRLTRRGVALSGGVLAALLAAHGASAAVPAALARALTRAAGAIASGAAYSELVSAGALHLSEGVLRMMTLSKLKALAVAAAVTAALTGGLGLGLAPAQAQGPGNGPVAGRVAATAAGPPAAPQPPAAADDAAFLRRACLDLRGTPPTDIERHLYHCDRDVGKRAKVVDWLLADAAAAERARLLRVEPVSLEADCAIVDGPRVVAVGNVTLKTRELSVSGQRLELWTGASNPAVIVSGAGSVQLRPLGTGADPAGEQWAALLGEPEPVGERARVVMLWLALHHPGGDEGGLSRFAAELLRRAARTGDDGAAPPPRPDTLPRVRLVELEAELKRVEALLAVDSDAEFLKRVTAAARGSAPTRLEELYFASDKDPKKREKLLDALLQDPAVVKKLGDDFKKRMLAGEPRDVVTPRLYYRSYHPADPRPVKLGFDGKPFQPPAPNHRDGKPFTVPVPPTPPAARGDRLGKLIDELLAANRTDAEVLEAVTLATAGRLPTDTEKRLTLALVARAADRRAAWLGAVKALAAPGEGGVEWEFHVAPATPAPPKAP